LNIQVSQKKYDCFLKRVPATLKNKFGAVERGALSLGYNSGEVECKSHYFLVLSPVFSDGEDDRWEPNFSRVKLVSLLIQFLLPFVMLAVPISRLLHRAEGLDGVSSYLGGFKDAREVKARELRRADSGLIADAIKRGILDVPRSLLAHVFDAVQTDAELRRVLRWASFSTYSIVALPYFVFLAFGLALTAAVKPASFGLQVLFVGGAVLSLNAGYAELKRQRWRLSTLTAGLFSLASFCVVTALPAALFADPSVVDGGAQLSFCALSLVAFALSFILLAFDCVESSAAVRDSRNSLAAALAAGAEKRGVVDSDGRPRALVECFSAVRTEEFLLRYVGDQQCELSNTTAKKRRFLTKKNASRLVLAVYVLIASVATDHGGVACLNVLELLALDATHALLARGGVRWTAHSTLARMAAARVAVALGGGRHWVIGHAAAYLAYGCSVAVEMCAKHFSKISRLDASAIVFLAENTMGAVPRDLAGAPEVVLLGITATFLFIVVIAAFSGGAPAAPVHLGGAVLAQRAFAVAAFFLVAIFGSGLAAFRAADVFRARQAGVWYFYDSRLRLPAALACVSYGLTFCCALYVWGETGQVGAFLVLALAPPSASLGAFAATRWRKNGGQFVQWPPDPDAEGEDESVSANDLAFGMLQSTLQGDDGTLASLELPPLARTDQIDAKAYEATIKIPVLPPKYSTKAEPAPQTQVLEKVKAKPRGSRVRRLDMGFDEVRAAKLKRMRFVDPRATRAVLTQWQAVRLALRFVFSYIFKRLCGFRKKRRYNARVSAAEDDAEEAGGDAPEEFAEAAFLAAGEQGAVGEAPKGGADSAAAKQTSSAAAKQASSAAAKQASSANSTDKECSSAATEASAAATDKASAATDKDASPFVGAAPAVEAVSKDAVGEWDEVWFWEAVVTGALLDREYLVLLSAILAPALYLVMGLALAWVARPRGIGHLVWLSGFGVCLSVFPIFHLFERGFVSRESVGMFTTGCALFVAAVAFAFQHVLDSRVDVAGALWCFDSLILYPLFISSIFNCLEARSNNLRLHQPLKKTSKKRWRGLVVLGVVLLTLQFAVWISIDAAFTFACLAAAGGAARSFAIHWALNDYYVPPKLLRKVANFAGLTTFVFIVVAFATYPQQPSLLCLTAAFAAQLFRQGCRIVSLWPTESLVDVWFSRVIVPSFSFSSKDSRIVDRTAFALEVCEVCVLGIAWGAAFAAFAQPISVGIFIMAFFTGAFVILFTWASTTVVTELGISAKYLSPNVFVEAASEAECAFGKESTSAVFEAVYQEVFEEESEDDEPLAEVHSDDDSDSDSDSEDDETAEAEDAEKGASAAPQAAEPPLVERKSAVALARLLEAARLEQMIETEEDFAGPFGFAGTLWLRCARWLTRAPVVSGGEDDGSATTPEEGSLQGDGFDSSRTLEVETTQLGASTTASLIREIAEHRSQEYVAPPDWARVAAIRVLEQSFARALEAEVRCVALFHLLVISAGDAFTCHEESILRRFAHESRFKLRAHGVSPPTAALSADQVDLQNLAEWLWRLDVEGRSRFFSFFGDYKKTEAKREAQIDRADAMEATAALKLGEDRSQREKTMFDLRAADFAERRRKRTLRWLDFEEVSGDDRDRFEETLRSIWEFNLDPRNVEERDVPLRESYLKHVLLNGEESTGNCRERLNDLEAGMLDCQPSRGREGCLQFVDPDFPPTSASLGDVFGRAAVGGWKHACDVAESPPLFKGGSDPDDVSPGVCVKDDWLLTALSMLSAAGGVADGQVDAQVQRLFVGLVDGVGRYRESRVGAFGVRLFVNGQWECVVVDDALPMLGDGSVKSAAQALQRLENASENASDKSSESAKHILRDRCLKMGCCAAAHSQGLEELWVSVLEKSVAKYYGTYAAIEPGYVHHGLELLTGCRAECVSISKPSRGVGKAGLWACLQKWFRMEYMIGAGSQNHSPSGLAKQATYLVLEVASLRTGEQLLKLGNPPGWTERFDGAWGPTSKVWRCAQLRRALNNDDPNAFWVSFDELCALFRCLFVCHYYAEDSTTWRRVKLSGQWSTAPIDPADVSAWRKVYTDAGLDPDSAADLASFEAKGFDIPAVPAPKLAFTAGGLPSMLNGAGVNVGKNPQWILRVHRPVTLRLDLSQRTWQGASNARILPVAAYVIRVDDDPLGDVRAVSTLDYRTLAASTGSAVAKRTVEAHVDDLEPGAYVLLAATLEPGMEGYFTLTLTTDFDVDLEQLWPEPESVSVKLLGKLRDARETAAAGKRRFALKGRALPDDAAAAVDDAAEDAADAAEDAPPPGKPPRTSRFGLTRAGNDAANAPPSADEKAPPSASDAPRKGRFGFKSFEKAAPPPDASDDEVE